MARKVGVFRNALYLYKPWMEKLQAYLEKRKELRRLKLIHNALPSPQGAPVWSAWHKHCKWRKQMSQSNVRRANRQAAALRKALGKPDYQIKIVAPPQWAMRLTPSICLNPA